MKRGLIINFFFVTLALLAHYYLAWYLRRYRSVEKLKVENEELKARLLALEEKLNVT